MHSFNLNAEHLMSEVYSYPFPEVRDTLDRLRLDGRFMLNTLAASEAADMLAPYDFDPPLELPAAADGSLNLDELHVPVIERIRSVVGEQIHGLGDFDYAYPTHGSSQAMFTLLAEWKAQGKLDSIAILNGDYEGYAAYAEALNIPVTRYHRFEDCEPKDGQMWFVSNPSATDGNWIDDETWQRFTTAGHQIVYDAAYVGLTKPRPVDVSSPNIRAVLTSPSKLFGVFRYRDTGVTYTREPVAAMYGTKWFKDVPALLDTLKLYETYGHGELYWAYRPVQGRVCYLLSQLAGVQVEPSDVLLLGHTNEPLGEHYDRFRRGGGHRFGLTKLFEDYEAAIGPASDFNSSGGAHRRRKY